MAGEQLRKDEETFSGRPGADELNPRTRESLFLNDIQTAFSRESFWP
jgi:hypothetical protein